jgi:YidC/Oxa1 family membrane protein insertase
LFNWFSLDYIYYPVSAIMWVWYKVFAFLIGLIPGVDGPTNFFAWGLSVMFLVFTLRAILYRPFVRQIETTRQMQELQPQIKALQKKYGKDRQRMAVEMQKLQKEHGFNPILGCLPMLAQVPVFLGLYHVLNSFNRTQTGFGRLGLTVEQNASLGNYVFSAADVRNFLDAHLFGAPIGASMIQKVGLDAFTEFNRTAVIAVGVPLMILAGVATHFNSRASVARQSPEAAANPQTAMMNKLALYVFPIGVVVGGPFLPIAIIMYWVSNNIWTYGQQHYVFGKIEKREEAKKQEDIERRAANAPAPGAKPARRPKRTAAQKAAAAKKAAVDGAASVDAESSAIELEPTAEIDTPASTTNGAAKAGGNRNGAAKSAPRRNPRPAKKRRT